MVKGERVIRKRIYGYMTIEYAIVTSVITIALFLPIPIVEESMVDMTMSAIKQFQAHTTTMLALP